MGVETDRLVWRCGEHTFDCGPRTHVMGILNVTPDSFSDGGQFFDPEEAVRAGIAMASAAADLVDVGGESTRPGSDPVPVTEELRRVLPVIKRLAAEVDVAISIDTRRADVAEAALDAGASVVNDVTAGRDPRMFRTVLEANAGMSLMHMLGEPKTMQQDPRYDDVVAEIRAFLGQRLEAAIAAGIERECLVVDPGLGFGKTLDHNLTLMRRIGAFSDLGRPVLTGPSRKSFIGVVTETDVDERLAGTAGAVAWLAANGSHIVRVHDVPEMVRVVRMVDAIRRAPER
jgi:dihydropteroate synthase